MAKKKVSKNEPKTNGVSRKRPRKNDSEDSSDSSEDENEVPLTRVRTDDDDGEKKSKWKNRQRVLIFGSRGLSHRDRHLMEDLRNLMPHSKAESKMRRSENLFAVNEIASMKNCNKTLMFEGRQKRPDLYLWASNIANGPSAKFQVENIHTMAELKLTGNCLKASRPMLSFDKNFENVPHLSLLKELFIQIFGIPRYHPKSQPFFDHVFTFSIHDNKIWFRNYQILTEEDGSLAEVGPRFVLNPIKIFDASFAGRTIWENGNYLTPTAHRIMMKKAKAGKYRSNVEAKAAYEASRPEGPTYDLDPIEAQVFAQLNEETAKDDEEEPYRKPLKKKSRKTASERKKAKRGEFGNEEDFDQGQDLDGDDGDQGDQGQEVDAEMKSDGE